MPITHRKVLIGLAPLLAIAALVVPTAAQAVPRYFSNSSPLKESNGVVGEAGVREVVGWGTIELKTEKGWFPVLDALCHNVVAGDVWNPVGGGAGKGKTQALGRF
jgi:hypothetical protein